MASKILEDLLSGTGPLVIIVFGFLLAYFVWDVIKKLSRVEGIEQGQKERMEKIGENVHELRNIMQKEIVHREMNGRCIEKLQHELSELNRRLIERDTIQNYKRNERARRNGHQ